MSSQGWFGLGILVGSLIAAWWSLTQGNRMERENRYLLTLLHQAYDDLNKAEQDAYGDRDD